MNTKEKIKLQKLSNLIKQSKEKIEKYSLRLKQEKDTNKKKKLKIRREIEQLKVEIKIREGKLIVIK